MPNFRRTPPISNIFTQILQQGIDAGVIPERTKTARQWYRGVAQRTVANINDNQLMNSDPTRFRAQLVPGRIYMFFYDAKLKKKLPYYDTFPMILPLEVYNNSFLGLNFHYLPPNYRAMLLDALYNLLNNTRMDETTKIQASYRLLKNVAQLKYFRPCIKKYLKLHVRSRFVSIAAEEWNIALFLPLQRFVKQPTSRVWFDSIQKIQFGKPLVNTNTRLWPTTR